MREFSWTGFSGVLAVHPVMLSWITKFLLLLNPSLVGSQSTTVCTDRWLVLKRPTIADFFAYRHGSTHQLCRRKIFRRGELGKSWRWRFLRLTIPYFTRRYSPSCIHQACLLWVVSASFPYACSNITRCAFARFADDLHRDEVVLKWKHLFVDVLGVT